MKKSGQIVGREQDENAPLSCGNGLVQNNHSGGIGSVTPSATGKMVQLHHGAATVSGE